MLPEGHTNISSFYHDGPGADAFDRNPLNHVLYHEVQDALYRLGHQDMHRFTITRNTGVGVILTNTIMRDARVMRDSQGMTDNG